MKVKKCRDFKMKCFCAILRIVTKRRIFVTVKISYSYKYVDVGKVPEKGINEMQDRKLEQALDIYFQDKLDGESEEFREAQKYLKLRIRPAMELLIEREDTEGMEQLERCGWFSAKELESFIRCAQEKAKLRSLVWLLHLKDKKYGYQKKEFSL